MTETHATGTVECDECGDRHTAEYSHEGRFGEGAVYAVVCPRDDLTDYYTTERVTPTHAKEPAMTVPPATPVVVAAYTAPNGNRVVALKHQGASFTVQQTPRLTTTVWMGSTRITKKDHPAAFHALVGAAFAEWERAAEYAADCERVAAETAEADEARREEVLAREARLVSGEETAAQAAARRAAEVAEVAAEARDEADGETPEPVEEAASERLVAYPPITTEECEAANASGLSLVSEGGSYSVRVEGRHHARLGRVRAVTETMGRGVWFRFAAYRPDGSRAGYGKDRAEAARLLAPAPDLTPATVTLTNPGLWR